MTLSVKNGSFAFRHGDTVFSDISFTLPSGSLTAVLGPNGAGKTTLLRCLTGLLPWKTGQSFLDGTDITTLSDRQFWQKVAYVPQARNASAAFTAEEMILLGRTGRIGLFSVPTAEDRERVRTLMEQLHIESLAGRKCTELSGGERQMVLIARALAAEPSCLILDEPESNLDFKNQLIVLDTLSALVADGITCLFNTHYPAHALARASHALLMKRGGPCLFGPSEEIITAENTQAAFGVQIAISETELADKTYRSILPLRVAPSDAPLRPAADGDDRCIAVIALIVAQRSSGERINECLHTYRSYLIGRMGMPYPDAGVSVITVTLDAPEKIIRVLSHQLSILPGVSVKTTRMSPERRRFP